MLHSPAVLQHITRSHAQCDVTDGTDTKNGPRNPEVNKANECFNVCSMEMHKMNTMNGIPGLESNRPSRFRIPNP